MASYTENLELLKKDPVADGADTFNIQTMLNDNWDKIDEAVAGKADLNQDGKIPSSQLPEMEYDPAGSAAAVQENLASHIANKANPHGVTSEQVGAMISNSTHYINSLDTLLTYAQSGFYTVSAPATGMPYNDYWVCLLFSDGRPVSGQYSRVVYASSANTNNLYKLIVTNGVNLGWIQLASLDSSGFLPVASGGTGVGSIAALAALLAGNGMAKIEVGSYVGTGGYGENSPCSIVFSETPKLVAFLCETIGGAISKYPYQSIGYGSNQIVWLVPMYLLNQTYMEGGGPGRAISGGGFDCYGKKSADGKTLTWYCTTGAEFQLNESGITYHYFAITF